MSQSNIVGLIMCMIGLCLNAFPTAIWRLSEKWKSEGASAPSEKIHDDSAHLKRRLYRAWCFACFRSNQLKK